MGTQGADLEEDWRTHVSQDLVNWFHGDELMFKPWKKQSKILKPLQTYTFWPNIFGEREGMLEIYLLQMLESYGMTRVGPQYKNMGNIGEAW